MGLSTDLASAAKKLRQRIDASVDLRFAVGLFAKDVEEAAEKAKENVQQILEPPEEKERVKMTWEQVLQRDDIVGGEVETQEDGYVYRSPISGVEIRDGRVYFNSPWVARLENGTWKNWPIYPFFVDGSVSPPNDIGDGRIQFNMPLLGFGVILPKGGNKLDPAKVEGLNLQMTV